MTTVLVMNLSLAFVVLAVGLLQKAHRRYVERPHASAGSEQQRDADLRRVLRDLDMYP